MQMEDKIQREKAVHRKKLGVCGKTALIVAFLPPARAGQAVLFVSVAQSTCLHRFGALGLSGGHRLATHLGNELFMTPLLAA